MSTEQVVGQAVGAATPSHDELTGTWILDAAHSVVQFSVRHMGIARLTARFDVLDGSVTFSGAGPELTATVAVDVDVSSISSGHPLRNELITSPEFLDVAEHPVLTFRATAGPEAADAQFQLEGQLTIKGVTRPAVLDVAYGGLVVHRGATRLGYAARTEIDRRDFGVGFDARVAGGDLVVSDRVQLDLQVELVKSA